MRDFFDLTGRSVVITGGAGFLGRKHAEAVAAYGAVPLLLDIDGEAVRRVAEDLKARFTIDARGYAVDITQEEQVLRACTAILEQFGSVDVLINNAANNPAVLDGGAMKYSSRLEEFSLPQWQQDMDVGLTGSFLCAKHFGKVMADRGKGSIINISSDLGVVGPNQGLYRQEGLPEDMQNVKPVTYSVIKTGIIGLTRYLATYWARKNVRCNALCPGGVFNGQPEEFLTRINALIPMERMAHPDELQGVIVFLASDASSYMTGAVLSVDGGRTCW